MTDRDLMLRLMRTLSYADNASDVCENLIEALRKLGGDYATIADTSDDLFEIGSALEDMGVKSLYDAD